jgi:predicted nucleic acid-binding protein
MFLVKSLQEKQFLHLPRFRLNKLITGYILVLQQKPCRWQQNVLPTLTASQFHGILENIKVFSAVMGLHIRGQSVMNGTNIVFDTSAVIKLLDNQYDLPSLGIDVDKAQLLTSVIVRMELLSKRNMTDIEKHDIQEFLNDLIVVPIDDTIEQKAIEIRRAASIKLPDCIVAATSIVLDALLLTDDTDLLGLSWEGLRAQRIF